MFTLDIEIINCFKNSRKLYTKMYMSLKWHRRDAAILSVAAVWRSIMTGGGFVSKTSAMAAHTSS